MTVEVKAEDTQVGAAGEVVPPKKVVVEEETMKDPKTVEKSSSYREESNFLSDLKDFERKALTDLKSKLEQAILHNNLFKKPENQDKEKPVKQETDTITNQQDKETIKQEKQEDEATKKEQGEEECQKQEEEKEQEQQQQEVNKNISLWGIPLLGSKGEEGTDVVLLKFLRARDFKVNEAFEMLKKTLQWRKESDIDSILEQDMEVDLSSAFYMNGVDREGHPVCYNIYGVFSEEELYKKAFGNEENRKQFLRWRFQLMEKGIQKLELKQPGGVTSMLQISDLKNSPAPSKKELRAAMNQAVGLLQDNYPEFVSRNIFINVPFWYYAFNAILSPFLTQRSKSKFVVARPAKVTETLLKYIPVEEIPVEYGGLKRENDFEFSAEDGVASELVIKAGATESIEIPAIQVGGTMVWDISVVGWEVKYKEEFVPSDEGSYTIIISKLRKMNSTIRNSFRNNEAGKVVLTIQNTSTKKKKIFYRYKTNKSA
ncbi:Sec14p-like phosphatidylinositol transfer family protein [Euphorbia peplus]|nr:Sec14p-like phosphatidylinositol transfer family protein [Euphorbia peplus]